MFTEGKSKSNTQVHRRTHEITPVTQCDTREKCLCHQYLISNLLAKLPIKACSKTASRGRVIFSLGTVNLAPAKEVNRHGT